MLSGSSPTLKNLESQFNAAAKKLNRGKVKGANRSKPSAGGSGGGAASRTAGNWFTSFLDRGLTYLEQKDAEKRAQKMREQGISATVVSRDDGTFAVVEEKPLWKNPLVIGAGALLLGVVIFGSMRARSNPPRRRRSRRSRR